MVEAAMSGFGPVMIGSGATTGGSCDFRSGLSVNVLNRMGSEKALKLDALNLATADSELNKVDPIGIYRLLVGEATFTDKTSGRVVTEKTLISPDFYDEAIGVWTDAGENGTGSKEEYRAILTRAKTFAETSGKATMFWISPSKRERSDGLPEHRAYLWKKNDKGEVTAYSYQLTGSNNTPVKTLLTLASDATFVDSQTLLWKTNQDTITHKKVFNAYRLSLSEKEASKIESFLDRFKKESELPDSERWSDIEVNKKQYEEKLRAVYKGDIKGAIEAVSSGFIGLARSVETVAAKIVVPSGVFYDEFRRIGEVDSYDNNKVIDDISAEEKEIIIKIIQADIVEPIVTAFIGVLQEVGPGRSQTPIAEFSKSDIADESQNTDQISTVIIPVVPIFEGILLGLTEQDLDLEQSDNDEQTMVQPPTQEFIQNLILLILMPKQSQEEISVSIPPEFSTPDTFSIIEDLEVSHDGPKLLQMISEEMPIKEKQESYDLRMEEIVTIADSFFEEVFIEKSEYIVDIKLLLELYKGEETTKDLKELAVLFLLHTFTRIHKDHKLLDQYTELSEISAKVELLLKDPVLMRRYEEFILCIEELFNEELLNDDGIRNFSIVELLKFMKTRQYTNIITIERLRGVRNTHVQNKNPKMKNSNFPPKGVIYQYLLSYDWYIIRLRGVIHEKTN